MTRKQELTQRAKNLRKAQYKADQRHNAKAVCSIGRELDKIHIELWEIENNKTWNS